MLEKRFERGGTLATDDYSTPFQYNLAQFELPLGTELPPYADLELEAQGVALRPSRRRPFSARTEPGGDELVVGRGGRGLRGEIEQMLAAASERGRAAALPRAASEERSGRGCPQALTPSWRWPTPPRVRSRSAADDPRAAVVLRYACGLAGFLDGDVPLGLIGRLLRGPAVQPGDRGRRLEEPGQRADAGRRGRRGARVGQLRGHAGGARRARLPAAHRRRSRDPRRGAVVSTLDLGSTVPGASWRRELAPAELREAAARWIVDPHRPLHRPLRDQGEPPARPAGGGDALIRVFGFADADEVGRHFAARAARAELPAAVAGHLTVRQRPRPAAGLAGPVRAAPHAADADASRPSSCPSAGWDRASHRPTGSACWDALRRALPRPRRRAAAVPVLRHAARHRAPLRHHPARLDPPGRADRRPDADRAPASIVLDRAHAGRGALPRGRLRPSRRARLAGRAATTPRRSWREDLGLELVPSPACD